MKDINISDNIKMLDGSYISYDDYIKKNEPLLVHFFNFII